MLLTIKDILNIYQHGLQKGRSKFLVAMGPLNKARFVIQKEHIKLHIAEFLVGEIDLNTHDHMGNTVLHIAIAAEKTSIARHLIEDGADINAMNYWGSTPAHAAATGMSSDSLELLLEHGADVNVKNNNDESPIDLAFASIVPAIQDSARFAYLI